MKKSPVVILAITVLLAVAAVWLHERWLRSVARTVVREMTGLDLELGNLNASLLRSRLELEDLKLENPEGFPEGTALQISRLLVQYDLPSLFTDTVHLPVVYLDVPGITVVRNEKGETNLDGLREARRDETVADPPGDAPDAHPAADPDVASARMPAVPQPRVKDSAASERRIRIDDLTIRLGTVSYLDYSHGGAEPVRLTQQLDVEVHRKDITHPQQIAAAIGEEIFSGSLANLGATFNIPAEDLAAFVRQNEEGLAALGQMDEEHLDGLATMLEDAAKNPDSPLNALIQSIGQNLAGAPAEAPAATPPGPEPAATSSDRVIEEELSKFLDQVGGQ